MPHKHIWTVGNTSRYSDVETAAVETKRWLAELVGGEIPEPIQFERVATIRLVSCLSQADYENLLDELVVTAVQWFDNKKEHDGFDLTLEYDPE